MFVKKKNSMKKTNLDKKNFRKFWKFGNFPNFQSLDVFQRSCEKQCFLHLEHI